jgi:hypothetical protein
MFFQDVESTVVQHPMKSNDFASFFDAKKYSLGYFETDERPGFTAARLAQRSACINVNPRTT